MAGSFADAFLKAGVTTEDRVKKIEKERIEESKVKEEKPESTNEPAHKFRPQFEKPLIERDPNDTVFSKLWNDEKSHKFVVHLIHAFSPTSRGEFAWAKDQLHQKTCCICKCGLMSKEDVFEKIDDTTKLSLDHLQLQLRNEITQEQIREDFSKIYSGRVLGVVSDESKAAFCNQCFKDFVQWLELMILRGNYEVNKIIRKEMVKQYEQSIRPVQKSEI